MLYWWIVAIGFIMAISFVTFIMINSHNHLQEKKLERYNQKFNIFVQKIKFYDNKDDVYSAILKYDTNFFIKAIKKNKKQDELKFFLKDEQLTMKEFDVLFDGAIVENKEYFKQRNKPNKEKVRSLMK